MSGSNEDRRIHSLELNLVVDHVRGLINAFCTWMDNNIENIIPVVRAIHFHIIFDKNGWLLHRTAPFNMIDDDVSDANLSEILDSYYRNNWKPVAAEFRSKLECLDLDCEAKAVFCEALDAHGAGFYRATPRLLFPEFERLVRVELDEGRLGNRASLKELRFDASKYLDLFEIASDIGTALRQFEKLYYHIYQRVETLEDVDRVSIDPVPNRHASLHGLVSYSTHKSSLNALIMAEFMFHVVAALKAARKQSPCEVKDTNDRATTR